MKTKQFLELALTNNELSEEARNLCDMLYTINETYVLMFEQVESIGAKLYERLNITFNATDEEVKELARITGFTFHPPTVELPYYWLLIYDNHISYTFQGPKKEVTTAFK